MSRIEIWKCKHSWCALRSNERQATIRHLASLVQRGVEKNIQADGGLYVVQKAEGGLLIWTVEMDEGVAAKQYESIRLDKYFEPLAYVAVTRKLNARVLATKLSVGEPEEIVQFV